MLRRLHTWAVVNRSCCMRHTFATQNQNVKTKRKRVAKFHRDTVLQCNNGGMSEQTNETPWAHLEFDLCDRLRKSLRVSGMGVSQIAAVLGVDRNTVSNYLGGRTNPTRPTLTTWAIATGVPLSWLLTGEVTADEADNGIRGVVLAGGVTQLVQTGQVSRYAVRDSNPEPADMYSAPALFLLSDPNKVAA